MTPADIQALIRDNPHTLPNAELVDTHISWVILTNKLAYKIKRPVRFSFLDFSTFEKRQHFCERELFLNRRITTGIYLGVVPIFQTDNGSFSFQEEDGQLVEHAVKMKRLPGERQMDLLLGKDLVNEGHMEQLAQQLANFHMSTEVVNAHPNLDKMQEDFADLLRVAPFVEEHWGADAALLLHKGEEYSKYILRSLRNRIYERHLEGFTVDGHGDLHTRNIFLLDQPVIFDCIEFNDHLRKLDVLNELAFLCMDLDAHGQSSLSETLLNAYNSQYICLYNGSDEKLFHYYKLYRANVRLKIHALKALQMEAGPELDRQLTQVATFMELFEKYLKT